MDTNAAFERHIRETYQYPQLEMEPDDSPCAGEYVDTLRQIEYEHWCKAWQASRAEIEIELPCGEISPSMHMTQRVMMNAKDVVKAITSHGIRIKGKTE